MTGSIVFIVGLSMTIVGILIYIASGGNDTAKIVLTVLATATLIYASQAMMLLQSWLRDNQEQKRFMANAKENEAIMRESSRDMLQLQNIQNKQAQMIQRQLIDHQRQTRLTNGNAEADIFDVSDYADLDNLDIEGLDGR